MLKAILEWFTRPTFQDNLQSYIESKNPKSPAEVDYWIKNYQHNVQKIGTF